MQFDISKAVGGMLQSPSFQYELRRIQSWASDELYKAVVDTVYGGELNDLSASGMYTRTFDLLAAIMPTDLIVTPSTIEFKVIFDESVMHHTTLYGSTKYGLSPGDPVGDLLIPWLNEGWDYSNRNLNIPYGLTKRDGAGFLEKTIAKIQAEVVGMVQGAIGAEVRKTGGRY